MSGISRRDFLAGLTATGATACATRWAVAAAAPKVSCGTDLVTLGRSGLRTSLLGIGTGTNGGSEQLELGPERLHGKLVRHALDRGIRYIDTADMYSHARLRAVCPGGRARDKYFIQTKTSAKHPRGGQGRHRALPPRAESRARSIRS